MIKIHKYFIFPLTVLMSASAGKSQETLAINALGNMYLLAFDDTVAGVLNGPFTGAGFSNTPRVGQLDSDSWSTQGWASGGSVAFGGSATSGQFARGSTTSAVSSIGIYSYGSSDRQLLLQPGNTPVFNGESITLKLEKATGTTINGWMIGYDSYRRNDSPIDSWLVVDLSPDGSTWYPVPDYFGVFMDNSGATDALGWVKAQTHLQTFGECSGAQLSVATAETFTSAGEPISPRAIHQHLATNRESTVSALPRFRNPHPCFSVDRVWRLCCAAEGRSAWIIRPPGAVSEKDLIELQ